MKIVFRVDASTEIGTGHVMRCVNLARELRNKKFEILFICRDFPGNLNKFIQEQGFEICVLPCPVGNDSCRGGPVCPPLNPEDLYAVWLGVPWEQDAEETLEAITQFLCLDPGLRRDDVDLLIVDHYGLDARWERKFKNKTKKILVIDDLANRPHDCDFVLDQNLAISDPVGADLSVRPDGERYKKLVPQSCQRLLGPSYALLNPAVLNARRIREEKFSYGEEFKSCLVFMGGTDPDNFSQAIALNIVKILPTLKIYLIIGRSNLNFLKLEAELKKYKNIEILIQPQNYFELLTQVDFVVGASGSSTWERCCVGVPSFFFQIADNQKEICESVSAIQAGVFLGDLRKLKNDDLVERMQKIVEFTPLDLVRMAAVGKALVDGLGVERVFQHVL